MTLRTVSLLTTIIVGSIALQSADATEQKLSLRERAAMKLALLKQSNLVAVYDALKAGVKYGEQASVNEANGDELAHERAAYGWGYEVGDPQLVRMVRFFWEGVQLGVFSVGDYQENNNGKSSQWATIESMVGGNGKEYTVDEAYVNDIFHDVSVATAGAERAKAGLDPDFEMFIEKHLNQ